MNERNFFIFVQYFCEFRCIFDEMFDLIFAKFLFNFRSIKIEIFRIKKIIFLREKLDIEGKVENFNEFRKNFERIPESFVQIS